VLLSGGHFGITDNHGHLRGFRRSLDPASLVFACGHQMILASVLLAYSWAFGGDL